MSNLSQFFALGGGNKIKSIQRVQAQQQRAELPFTFYTWSGVTALISAVDPTKTLLICSPSDSGYFVYAPGGAMTGAIGQYNNIGHGAFLSSNTQISFNGPDLAYPTAFSILIYPARMVVQVVEFE